MTATEKLLPSPRARRVRRLGGLAFVLATLIALAVRLGLNDGGWPLFVPAFASAGVVVWPMRPVVIVAILVTAGILILGSMTVGILYGFPLVPLIFALAAFRTDADQLVNEAR
jgi:hypothetical protein